MEPEVRQLVRRVVGRVLAERGRASARTVGGAATPRPEGVHVEVRPCDGPARPAGSASDADRRDELAASTPSARPTTVAVGADHGGFRCKQDVLGWVREVGCVAVDLGTRDENPVDYPDVARKVAEAVRSGQCDLGILVDGAGIGSAIAANKVPGVRAATCWDETSARNAREHNHANVLSLGGRMLSPAVVCATVRAFLSTPVGP